MPSLLRSHLDVRDPMPTAKKSPAGTSSTSAFRLQGGVLNGMVEGRDLSISVMGQAPKAGRYWLFSVESPVFGPVLVLLPDSEQPDDLSALNASGAWYLAGSPLPVANCVRAGNGFADLWAALATAEGAQVTVY